MKKNKLFKDYWTVYEREVDGYQKLIEKYNEEQLIEEVIKMQMWCIERKKSFSLRRFYNWMRNKERWLNTNDHDIEIQERQRTKELLDGIS